MASRLAVPLAIVALVAAGWVWFPGHTWLQSDSQIYAAILENLHEPNVLEHDFVATRPHVSWTIYDEVTLGLERATGLSLRDSLYLQQVAARVAGVAGAYLLAGAAGLAPAGALLAAGCYALGAVVGGPTVLTFEYEPIPRGIAVHLLLLALGLLETARPRAAAAAAVLATIYHPTTTAPFWVCLALCWLMRREQRPALAPLLAATGIAAAALGAARMLQAGPVEGQAWFGRITPEVEAVQRLRGPYNWIGMWPREWLLQYPLLMLYVYAAWRRLRGGMAPAVKWFSLALPVVGLALAVAQYVLLDLGKWVLLPQFQPARSVLFITVFAQLLGAAAAWKAAARRRVLESLAWLTVVFALPANSLVVQLFTRAATGPGRDRLAVVLLLAALATAAAWSWERLSRPLAAAVLAVALAAPFALIPTWGAMRNAPALHSTELDDLCAWARSATPAGAVFLFADAQRGLEPGIFRAEALRAVYVDWKGGGQANLLPGFAMEWKRRWEAVGAARLPLKPLAEYRGLGIDYLVAKPANRPAGVEPVYRNDRYEVMALRP